MFRIREVKPEIRVLGISVRVDINRRYNIVGVVYRGKLHLDGVLKAVSESPDVTQKIIEMILGSSHVHQLRVILLDQSVLDPDIELNPILISREVSKSVITIGFNEQTYENIQNVTPFRHRLDKVVNVQSIGLDAKKAQKILETTSKTGAKPEVIKIAGILALSLKESIQHNL